MQANARQASPTDNENAHSSAIRHDWSLEEVSTLLAAPLLDLLLEAQLVHREFFVPNEVQASSLLSIKTGACPEDCKYCPQSGHYNTELENEKLMEVQRVLDEAKEVAASGATRFCMGAAWKNPPDKEFPMVLEMVRGVKELGLETCMTLGMLTAEQSAQLADAGLDYYNHNLDTSPEFYSHIITTRSYQDRLDTLQHVRDSGMKVCAGGIVGMGEQSEDRAGLLHQLANLPVHPESVPINMLVKVEGTPLEDVDDTDPIEFIRCIAVARILMPKSYVRLSAGRETMSDETQALAFMAGANSIFYGDKLLTTANPGESRDGQLLKKLGIGIETVDASVNYHPPVEGSADSAAPEHAMFYDAATNADAPACPGPN